MTVKAGDIVRLIAIPPGVKDDEVMQTRTLFERCLGKSFTIAGFETVEGLPYKLVKLDVGHILGKAEYLETILVEPEYLQLDKSE
jgi:hypothetical protein